MADKVQYNVRIHARLVEQIRAISEVQDKSMADLTEEAMAAYIQQLKADPEWSARAREWVEHHQDLVAQLTQG